MKLRNVYSAQARSVKLVSQKNRRQRTMKHATSYENCHTRKSSHVFAKQRLSSIQQNKIIYTIPHMFSQQNRRLKLDYTSRFVNSHNRSSCSFLFFSKSRFRTRARVHFAKRQLVHRSFASPAVSSLNLKIVISVLPTNRSRVLEFVLHVAARDRVVLKDPLWSGIFLVACGAPR